jgi:hypothetical protein
MKVGDLVLRSYHSVLSPGIIVAYVSELMESYDGDDFYDQHFIVSWPDGTLSKETIWELDDYESAYKDHKKWIKENRSDKNETI